MVGYWVDPKSGVKDTRDVVGQGTPEEGLGNESVCLMETRRYSDETRTIKTHVQSPTIGPQDR